MADDDDWLALVNEQENRAKQQEQKKNSNNSTGLESKVCKILAIELRNVVNIIFLYTIIILTFYSLFNCYLGKYTKC